MNTGVIRDGHRCGTIERRVIGFLDDALLRPRRTLRRGDGATGLSQPCRADAQWQPLTRKGAACELRRRRSRTSR
jgi:hypothetical protein